MSDMSDNENLEKKPKRTMTDAQREALKKGRELAKMNREAKLKEVKNEVVEEVKVEPVVETKPKRTRKPKEVIPVREPSPEPVIPPTPAKAKTPRQKKTKVVPETNQVIQPQVQQAWTAPKPVRPSMVFM